MLPNLKTRNYRFILLSLLSAFILLLNPILCRASSGPSKPFDFSSVPVPPDYSNMSSWAAMPANADTYPVDVLYFHPTTYFSDKNWNQSMKEAEEDSGIYKCIKTQAGIFNGIANLYAPHFRQATIFILDVPAGSNNNNAQDLAYYDVERAFDYYINNFNKGRPFILAGHSQGSRLLLMLLKRRFCDTSLQKKLIAAYVIGWSVTGEDLKKYPHLQMSNTADQTGCIISYNTQGIDPAVSIVLHGAIGVNPLTMTLTEDFVPAEKNMGALFFTEDEIQYIPHYIGAQTVDGVLTVPTPSNIKALKPAKPGFYHSYDYFFFYCNLVENVKLRIDSYLNKQAYLK